MSNLKLPELRNLLSQICLKDSTTIGKDLADKIPVRIEDETFATHAYLLGGTGSGKTVTLSTILMSLILQLSHCVCLIDLVGSGYDQVIETLGAINRFFEMQCRSNVLAYRLRMAEIRDEFFSRIHVLDFSQPDHDYCLNPLEIREEEYEHTSAMLASDVIGALERAFTSGKVEMSSVTRQLSLNMRTCFSITSEIGGTIIDAYKLFSLEPDRLRQLLRQLEKKQGNKLKLHFIRDYLESYVCEVAEGNSPKEKRDLVHSMWNMLGAFLSIDSVYDFLAPPKSNLDIDGIVRNGGVLLVKIPSTVDMSAQVFLGSLLLNKIQSAAARRDKADFKTKPVTIVCDEFHNIFNGPFWQSEISQVRNYGVRLILSHQNESQLHTDGSPQFLESIQSNTFLHFYYRMSEDDALKAAYRVFKPLGTKERLQYEETSESVTTSMSRTFSRSKSKAISRTIARSKTQTITLSNGTTLSVSRGKGVTVVRAIGEGWTVAQGKNWSRFSSKGVTVTKGKSHTTVESHGEAQGNAESVSDSVSNTNSAGSSSNTGSVNSTNFSDAMTFGDLGLDSAMSSARMGRGDSQSNGRGFNDSRSHSVGNAFSKGISNIVNSAKAISTGTSHNVSGSKSTGTGYGESTSEAHSKTISSAVSMAQNITKGLAKSLSESQGQSVGVTESEGETNTESESEGVQFGISNGKTTAKRKAFYNVDDEARILGYQISGLKKREMFLLNRITGEATKLRTIEMPVKFDNRLFGKDYTEDFLDRVRPEKGKIPEKDVFEQFEEDQFKTAKALDAPEGF